MGICGKFSRIPLIRVRFMVFNATFHNISAISRRSVLLVEETGENQTTDLSLRVRVSVMVFNATFINISVISWRSVLLGEETGVPGEIHRIVASHWQTLSHNVVSSTPWQNKIWRKAPTCHKSQTNFIT